MGFRRESVSRFPRLQSFECITIAVLLSFQSLNFGCQSIKKSELTQQKTKSESACIIYVPPSLQEQFAQSQDTLKKFVLRHGSADASCVRSDNRYNDLRNMVSGRGCITSSRFVVSEEGHYRAVEADGSPVLARFVDFTGCGNGQLFISGVNKKIDKFEIISSDPMGSTLHFYTQTSGPNGNADFSYHGSSFHQAPVAEMNGTTASHPCTRCHVNGGLVMKELREPWANWHGPTQVQFRIGVGLAFRDPEVIMTNLNQGTMSEKEPFFASALESMVKANLIGINKENIRRIKAGEAIHVPQEAEKAIERNLRQLLRPLFCETEINLVSKLDSDDLLVPKDLYLSRLLMPLKEGRRGFGVPPVGGSGGEPGDGVGTPLLKLTSDDSFRLRSSGGPDEGDLDKIRFTHEDKPYFEFKLLEPAFIEKYRDFLDSKGISTPAAGDQRHSKFHGLIPSRSFVDDDFVSRLVSEGILEEKLALSILMVDFPNPVFSSSRCSLLERIPTTPLARFKKGEDIDAAAITEAVRSSMAADKGAGQQLVNNLKSSNTQLATRVGNYLDKCREGSNVLKDSATVYRLMRAKNQRLVANADKFAIEGFVIKMFPEGDKLKALAYKSDLELGLTEQCTLNLP